MLDLYETFRKADVMKLSEKLPRDIMTILIPFPAPSRTSLSFKTSGRDLEDRWCLDEVPDVGSY